jgi:hypothetical protein
LSIIQHLVVLALAIAFGFAIKRYDKYGSTSPVMCSAIFAICLTALMFIAEYSTTLEKGILIAYGVIAAISFLVKYA